jgi:UDP-N-acetylmuramate dehydrogenase
MKNNPSTPIELLQALQQAFGDRLQQGASLARYTAARLGGPAQYLLEVDSLQELVDVVSQCWRYAPNPGQPAPFVLLGGGSNILVSDRGVSGLTLINRARQIRFDEQADPPFVRAESGANLGLAARQAALHGLAGLEWAAGIPGTVGGAVVGNAGAHDGDMSGNLVVAEILQRSSLQAGSWQPERWEVEKLAFGYRSSALKSQSEGTVVLAAQLSLQRSTPQAVQAKIDQFVAYRRRTQPPGASMGSMFKNPSGDYAGRLIEAAGLKGLRVGNAQISELHANFFINLGDACAADVYELIQKAQQAVADQFGVGLELEVELLGDW